MMNSFLAVVKKEIGSVLRDGTIIIAVLIQLFIASFSSALLLGMLSLYDADTIMKFGGAGIKVGVVSAPDDVLGSMMSERGLTVFYYGSLAEAEDGLYNRQVTAIVVVPKATGETSEIQLYLPDSDTFSSLIRMVIQEPLKQYENYLRAQNGIEVRYTDLTGKPATSFEFVYSVLIPLLMFFPAFVAGSMVIDSLTEEVENNTLQTLLSAPLTINGMIAGKITAAVIVAIVQCVTWLTLLQVNGTVIQNLIWVILLAVIVAGLTTTFAALGAVFFKDRERSQFVYSLALLAMVSIGTLLNLSPITTMSRLSVGDPYTSGLNIAVFAALLGALWLLLWKVSRRLMV
jgi:ABC-type Na+ efflux pump permease subunit